MGNKGRKIKKIHRIRVKLISNEEELAQLQMHKDKMQKEELQRIGKQMMLLKLMFLVSVVSTNGK